ncbi:hypothetical protein GGTG_03248 [Gaeumannomyces tritici R3-111a-1]|uniref:Rhodopsin domain-containing protein n=1 Tax=Gaeumannomyces tritici (strain R3-111a-1) TaxID=644352 RepID=J3NPP1_GAET3|nr:hypothetical protein GGTG_03248 [Gaeumannomyces tritici R3-111a-1]EJT78146.1 hypothetical protein GGTG_03248 [Gaeumannomyces tritici R3-111a-1]
MAIRARSREGPCSEAGPARISAIYPHRATTTQALLLHRPRTHRCCPAFLGHGRSPSTRLSETSAPPASRKILHYFHGQQAATPEGPSTRRSQPRGGSDAGRALRQASQRRALPGPPPRRTMRREDCVGGVGGAIPWPPDAEPLGPGCSPDAGMRGLNFAIQMAAAVLVLGFFLARSYAKWAVSSACAGRKLVLLDSILHHYGDGYHAWDLAPETFKNYKLWLYASAVLYCPAVYLTKVTPLLLMARVFAVKEQIARGIYLFIVLITVLYTPVQAVKTILCVPIPAFWDGGVEPDSCFDSRKVFITDIALALCTDAVILILPVFLAWPLHLGTWKKVKIALLLGAGAGAIGTDALRISKVVELQYETDTSGRFTLLTVLT